MLTKELRGRKLKITRSMDAEGRFHQKRMAHAKYCIHVKHNLPRDLISMNWTLKHVSVKGQIVEKHAKVEASSTSNTKTSKQKSKVKWRNGNQKLIATTVSSREMGQKRRGEERPRVVKCTQRHRRTKEATEAQMKDAAGTSSKKWTVTFQHA